MTHMEHYKRKMQSHGNPESWNTSPRPATETAEAQDYTQIYN